jgi:hypothetical protein
MILGNARNRQPNDTALHPKRYDSSISVIFCTGILFFHCSRALKGQGLLIIEASRSTSDTPHSVGLFRTSDGPVAENSTLQHTQHSQQTDFHDPTGIRNHNLSRRGSADPRLRSGGHRDRPHRTSMNKSTLHIYQYCKYTANYQYRGTLPFPYRYTQHYL